MEEINKKIEDFLQQKEMDYWEAVELYQEHPQHRKNLVINFNQRWQKSIMHSKIVYELEKLIGAKFSGKKTILNQRPAVLPYKLIDETKEEAPVSFDYKIKFKDLPKNLQELVIQKGQLYNALNMNKRKLAKIGESNDDKSIAKRVAILKEMRAQSDRIKKIHSLLMQFDEEKGFKINKKLKEEEANEIAGRAKNFFTEIEQLKQTPVGGIENDEEHEEQSEEDRLDELFHYKDMNYWQLKNLLTKTRSAYSKQKSRAENPKNEKVRQSNLEKMEWSKKMINWLVEYFKNNEEPKE